MDFLDKRLSKELYTDLSQIQGAVLAATQPLISICIEASDRMGPGLAEDPENGSACSRGVILHGLEILLFANDIHMVLLVHSAERFGSNLYKGDE